MPVEAKGSPVVTADGEREPVLTKKAAKLGHHALRADVEQPVAADRYRLKWSTTVSG